MKKDIFIHALAAVITLIAVPTAVTSLVKGDAGMAVMLLLFFAVDPLYFIVSGIFSGKHGTALWYQPALCALLFLGGIAMATEEHPKEFYIYAVIYFMLGTVSLVVSSFFWPKRYGKR